MKQYAAFFAFLLRFFGAYIVGTLIYSFYLNSFDASIHEVDAITWSVAKQTRGLLEALGYLAQILPHATEASIKLLIEGVYVARIVEGCNAISVMLLFSSFIFAFKGKWKTTLLYIVLGVVLLHLMNVLRIALLSIALLYYPQYESVLHGVIFPGVIYGSVVFMWLFWVNRFSKHGKKKK